MSVHEGNEVTYNASCSYHTRSLTVMRYKLRLPTLTEIVQLSCLACPGSSFFSAKQTSQGSSFMLNVLSVSPSDPLLSVTWCKAFARLHKQGAAIALITDGDARPGQEAQAADRALF